MRRRLEWLLPAGVLVGFVATAVVTSLLLTSARDRGVEALEESATAEVEALASTQNQRFVTQLESVQRFVVNLRLEFVQGSATDAGQLDGLFRLLGEAAETGFFLVDGDGVITAGVLLQDAGVGDRYEWPGLEDALERPAAEGPGVLGLGDGVTTDQQVLPIVVPVAGDGGAARGAFVFEQAVSADSAFNQEIGVLQRGESGTFLFLDGAGSVIASNDASRIAAPVGDERIADLGAGFHRLDDVVAVVAEVPAVGWQVVFTQDADEFEEALAGPLESVGRILVFALLLAGLVVLLLLVRRLRAARAERDRLEQLTASQQEFISIVSHELRTPVAGVLGFLETSLDHWDAMDDAARRSAVDRAAANARRLQAMTRDVLDTQSLESGRLVHAIDHVDLARELRDAVEAVRGLDAERELVLQVPDGPVWVAADPDRLQQVLANLIDNARKHSPVVEPIEVGLELADGHAEVRVRDRGAGIPEESIERIFDKFVRGRGESVTGTGLGLYISRQIIDAHGGRIWAESTDGGATFRFVLPVVAPPISGPPPEVVNT